MHRSPFSLTLNDVSMPMLWNLKSIHTDRYLFIQMYNNHFPSQCRLHMVCTVNLQLYDGIYCCYSITFFNSHLNFLAPAVAKM